MGISRITKLFEDGNSIFITSIRIPVGGSFDIEDADGANFNLNLSGNITREKVLKAFEFLDLMNIEDTPNSPQIDSVGAKIWNIVDKFFPLGKFTSSTILENYEDEYNEPIKLSIISTYLSRFTEKGRIERARTGREWTYQTIKISQKQRS